MVYSAPEAPPVVAPPPVPAATPVTLTFGGSKQTVSKPRIVIGRSREADVRVPDESMSRRHAEIRQEDGEYWLVDLGSMNGTRVNGKRVDRRRLADGDTIVLGSTEIVFGRPAAGS
jgi:pSer/pThr/pTyr-binding forkhead associated (FHA) protein